MRFLINVILNISKILLLISLLFCEYALSDTPSRSMTNNEINQDADAARLSIELNTATLEKTIRESIRSASEKPDSNAYELVNYTKYLVFATFALAIIALWQGFQLMRSVNLSRQIFISQERPWVVIDEVTPASDLNLNNGLSFTFSVKNFGKSPANNVHVSSIMHLPHRGDVHEAHKNIREDQSTTLQQLAKNEECSFGHLLTPGNNINIAVRCENQKTDYQKAAAVSPTGEIFIFIIGQVSYKFVGDNSWHESSFMFSVKGIDNKWLTLENEITPIDKIKIEAFSAGFEST